MQRVEEEITRTVAGKETARAVCSVGGGGESEKNYARFLVAETGNGLSPIGLICKGGSLFAGDLFAPLDQARAAAAGDDLLL